ncbi:hypothetical protein JCM19241_276 [Vibrio ishigakensis]|uniref:Uncharacterized protein n=1 Tax=Vibrio ishigakensis TaxID=1481914 RepID=A0A0B8QLN4_9VIBR|nr:hypothetical protein JCM19241_276 [Vibrio ishigakensis]
MSLALFSPVVFSNNSVEVKYLKQANNNEKNAYELIVESGVNEQFTELVNALFPFEEPMKLVYGGSEGPLYDPSNHTVYIPYAFVLEAQHYFSKHRSKSEVDQGAIDTLMHTLLHEAGHALVSDNGIPILGKEEDAVDNLATIIMLQYLDNGAEAAINAADMFSYESEEGGEYYDFGEYAGVHSFDMQRYFATLCLVYGSDPEGNKGLLDEIEEDYLPEQKETCEETYLQLDYNWHEYLKGDAKGD